MIDYARLVTPREDGSVLVEPAADVLGERLAGWSATRRRVDGVLLAGQRVGELRAALLEAFGLRAPVVAAGHQVEFFHAGVFAKNVAVRRLADGADASAVFLSVDSDQLKQRELLVPQNTTDGPRVVAVGFTDAPFGTPAEWLEPQPREHWLAVFGRVASILDHFGESLLGPFSEAWIGSADGPSDAPDFCRAMAAGRAAAERTLDLRPLRELRVSQLSTTPAFLAFFAHLVLHARQAVEAYNAAQAAYRRRFAERNRNRPVPPLTADDGRFELPFWIARRGPRRQRLYVVPRRECVEVQADDVRAGCLPLEALQGGAALAEGWSEALSGWHLRPRALTLSCFVRLVVADLFVHGIGGARYDAMTEDFTARFLDVELPPAACVTATLYLPLARRGVDADQIARARRASRDVRFNPQRYLSNVDADLVREREELIHRSRRLREAHPDDHATRRMIFSEIRRLNERILRCDPWRAAELDRRVEALEYDLRLDRIALNREYFFALHRVRDLRRLAERLTQRLKG